jgi:hypothetical protein
MAFLSACNRLRDMIVNFSTRYGRLTLLGDAAVTLLRLAGHSGTVPSAVLAADLPGFLARLRAGLETQGGTASPPPEQDAARTDDESHDAGVRPDRVTLSMRAAPLVAMIENAIARGSDLMWERG